MWELNNSQITNEQRQKSHGKLENNINENKYTIYQNLWDVAKAVVKGGKRRAS